MLEGSVEWITGPNAQRPSRPSENNTCIVLTFCGARMCSKFVGTRYSHTNLACVPLTLSHFVVFASPLEEHY